MPVHCRVLPSIKFTSTHLNTWVERGAVRVKCLTQEHNTMSPARDPTQTARSRVELTNHEATALYYLSFIQYSNILREYYELNNVTSSQLAPV